MLFSFIDEETEAERLRNLPEAKRLIRSKTKILNITFLLPLSFPLRI